MDPFLISTIILTIWAALGPLLGVRYGNELARRSQKEHWLNDNAKEEYRELLSALFDAGNISILNRALGRQTTSEEESKEEESGHHLYSVIYTRLFIRDFVEREKIADTWKAAFKEYDESQDLSALRKSLRDLIQVVVNDAKRLKT